MAFSARGLSVLAYANGFTLWHYKAGADGLDAITAPGFFEDEASMFAPGDIMMVSAPEGARVLCVGGKGRNHPVLAPMG